MVLEDNVRLRSERAALAEDLRESKERFKTVLDQSIDIVYRRNLKKDIYDYISPAIETVSGFSAEEFSRVASSELLEYIHPDDRAVVLKRFEQFEQSRHGAKTEGFFEFRLKCKDGGYRWISDSGVLVTDEAGTPLYHVGVARDITARKQIEEALRKSNEELEEKVAERTARLRRLSDELSQAEQRERKRLSDFLHDDLQQVLVAAKLEVEKQVISRQSDADGMRKLLGLMTDALTKTRSVIHELVTPLLFVVGLEPALRQLAAQMRERHGLQVVLDAENVADALPDSLRMPLFHSVRELLFNVAKHAGADTASVKVRFADGRVEITVCDTGKGFVPEKVLSDSVSGTGYGLYSIRERMIGLDGRMSVMSAPGCGTRVTLRVPVAPELSVTQRRQAGPTSEVCQAGGPAGRIRVLVADDHDVVRRGIIALLSLEPALAVVGQAANGREALEHARQLRPDVVVMDVRMPGMDGIEATRLIKADLPDTLVVGVSAFVEDGFRQAMMSAGAADLLDKADVGDILAQTIVRGLAARSASS